MANGCHFEYCYLFLSMVNHPISTTFGTQMWILIMKMDTRGKIKILQIQDVGRMPSRISFFLIYFFNKSLICTSTGSAAIVCRSFFAQLINKSNKNEAGRFRDTLCNRRCDTRRGCVTNERRYGPVLFTGRVPRSNAHLDASHPHLLANSSENLSTNLNASLTAARRYTQCAGKTDPRVKHFATVFSNCLHQYQ